MRAPALRWAACVLASLLAGGASAQIDDPRLREVVYDPRAVVSIPVKRGVVTHIVLDADESLTDVGSGFGGVKRFCSWRLYVSANLQPIEPEKGKRNG